MRHRKLSRRFSRTSSHRIAMMRNLSISLIEHEVIKTTVEKGKELRRFFEPLVTRAKEDNLHNRRLVISELNSKEAASKLFSDLGPRFKETNGGYIRLIKAGFREGDKADICYVELTCREEAEKELVDDAVIEEKAETKEVEAKEPETKEVEAKEPETKEVEAKEPETKEVEAKEPETKEVEAKEPETKEPTKKKEKSKESWWSRFFK
jgi:large subunit ribosomal protein L17